MGQSHAGPQWVCWSRRSHCALGPRRSRAIICPRRKASGTIAFKHTTSLGATMFCHALAITTSIVMVSIPSASQPKSKKAVRVLDAHFKCVKTLSSSSDLLQFERLWSNKQIVSLPSKPAWNYKLDLIGFENGGRWLYCSSGQTERLTKRVSPPYQVVGYRQLNELLGIPNQSVAPVAPAP